MFTNYTLLFTLQKLLFLPLCRACNKTLGASGSFCFSCRKQLLQHSLNQKAFFFTFEEPVPALVRDLRNLEGWNAPKLMIQLMRRKKCIASWHGNFDSIVLAPSSKKNGMIEFAKALAKELNIPLLLCLSKIKRTQHEKNAFDRMDASCFVKLQPGFFVAGKRLLLLDDVSTTGTTLEMSAYILRKHGAKVEPFSLAHKMVPSLKRESQKSYEKSEEVYPFFFHFSV